MTSNRVWTMTIIGWFVAIASGLVTYLTRPAECTFLARLNIVESPWGAVVLLLAFGFFGYSAYQSISKSNSVATESSDRQYRGSSWLVWVCLLGALVALPFNTHDLSFYFNAGKAAHEGVSVYTAAWPMTNEFNCPATTNTGQGIMYGPLAVSLFSFFYNVTGGSVVWFAVAWKVFMALMLVVTVWIATRLVNRLQGKAPASMAMWWYVQPLLVWETVTNGHFDIVWVACTMGALLAATYRRWWLVLLLLTVGIWIKFIPVLLVPWLALWWWQGVDRNHWIASVRGVGAGLVISALITIWSWQPYWVGPAVLAPIIMQTKWAVTSIFATVYYSLKPVSELLFAERAHWVLTRLVQGGLAVVAVYLVWPLVRTAWLILLKKITVEPVWYLKAVFVSLLVYLSIWQKSFWPWYITWLLPFGLIVYAIQQTKPVKNLVQWLGTAPLLFYAVWFANHFVRGTDAPSELWFYWVIVLLVWPWPLLVLWRWRARQYEIS